ncbi:Universal stress protein A [Thalassocella blandensis]|nr:Universal stress protein A [Thalassocella blandensis]
MSAYCHILVGLDLTEESRIVLQKATELGKNFNASITAAHILEPLAFAYGGDMPIDLTEAQAAMEEQATLRLAKLCEEFDIHQDRQIVTLGQPASELHEIAEKHDVDLIVVGSHGKHGLAMLFSSTAKGVVAGAKCDVLAVRV